MTMRAPLFLASVLFALGCLAACPLAQPSTVTSVDGLSGGALTSGLTAPSVTTPQATTVALSATSVTAEDVSATTLSVAGTATVQGLARAGAVLQNVIGAPIGTTLVGDIRGYAAANAKCSATFPATGTEPIAHVCTQAEVFLAVQTAPDSLTAEFVGAAYNTFTFGSPFDAGGAAGKSAITDCAAWGAHPFHFANADSSTIDVAAVLGKDDRFGFFPTFGACADELKFACCR
jgi:hypothetical protein